MPFILGVSNRKQSYCQLVGYIYIYIAFFAFLTFYTGEIQVTWCVYVVGNGQIVMMVAGW